jgi:flagellar motor switch protein FliM
MTEEKNTERSITNKKTYFKKENKRKFSKEDLKRFKKIADRFDEILENEKKLNKEEK